MNMIIRPLLLPRGSNTRMYCEKAIWDSECRIGHMFSLQTNQFHFNSSDGCDWVYCHVGEGYMDPCVFLSLTFGGGCMEIELLLGLTSLSSSIKIWMACKTWIRNCNFIQLNVEKFHHISVGQCPIKWCTYYDIISDTSECQRTDCRFTQFITSSVRLGWHDIVGNGLIYSQDLE